MSLINDLLCDLQERNAPVPGFRLRGLTPVRRVPAARRLWPLAPLGVVLLASSAGAIWYVDDPHRSALPSVVHDPTLPHAVSGTADPKAARSGRDQRFATLGDFSRSLKQMPAQKQLPHQVPGAATLAMSPKLANAPLHPAAIPQRTVSVNKPFARSPSQPATAPASPPVIATATKVVTEDPRTEALAALSAGRAKEAANRFRDVVTLNPDEHEGWHYLSRALDEMGQSIEAEGALSEALVAVSEPAPVARNLARRLLARGATLEALRLLEAYRPTTPLDPDHDAFIAAVQQRLGRHDIAAERYQGILAVRPQAGAWWVGLAISEEARGNGSKALDAYLHARNIGNLDARLAAYADKRISAMQEGDRS